MFSVDDRYDRLAEELRPNYESRSTIPLEKLVTSAQTFTREKVKKENKTGKQ